MIHSVYLNFTGFSTGAAGGRNAHATKARCCHYPLSFISIVQSCCNRATVQLMIPSKDEEQTSVNNQTCQFQFLFKHNAREEAATLHFCVPHLQCGLHPVVFCAGKGRAVIVCGGVSLFAGPSACMRVVERADNI